MDEADMTRPDEPSRRFDVRAETGRRAPDPDSRTTIRRAPRRNGATPG